MTKQKESHIIWNKHNPHDKIERGCYKDVIHHKDGNHENNDIDNLQKMGHGEHVILHVKGSKFPNKKKPPPFTEEHKKKLSLSRKGIIFTEEHKRNISIAGKKKKKPTEETKRRMSLGKIGNQNAKGIKHSEEFGKAISLRMIGNKHSLGNKLSEETKIKISLAMKGKYG